jgi:hypothetical protein
MNGNVNSIQHTALYYLNEEGISAAINNTLKVSFTTGTTRSNVVYAAVYDHVNQTIPVSSLQTNATNASSVSFSPALTVGPFEQAVKVIISVRSGNTTPYTINNFGTNWTVQNQQTRGYSGLLQTSYGIRKRQSGCNQQQNHDVICKYGEWIRISSGCR